MMTNQPLGVQPVQFARLAIPSSTGPASCRLYRRSRHTQRKILVVVAGSGLAKGKGTITEQMFAKLPAEASVGGAGGGTTYKALQAVDKAWYKLRNMKTGAEAGPAPSVVIEDKGPLKDPITHDIIVCGGTLGIFFACALQLQGFRVAVIERGLLKGRAQEWNISRKELAVLLECGLLSMPEIESCIQIVFNPVRVGFHNGVKIWTRDVLNLGISPSKMIELVKSKFLQAGGSVLEYTSISSVRVHPNGVTVELRSSTSSTQEGSSTTPFSLTCKLLLDCMGHFSPIVQQIRWGQRPDGVCLVVGSLGRGFKSNDYSDLIYTNTDAILNGSPVSNVQYFWEAFPAGSGPSDRTTYMFAYTDGSPDCSSLESLLEDYWCLMPQYQGTNLDELQIRRIMFGFFPNFKDSPLKPKFDRILQIGDAGGLQSPLSFGGFGAMLRHLQRLTKAVNEAMDAETLDRNALSIINAYNPGLSGSWMMHRTMSMRPGIPPEFINNVLSDNFRAMKFFGEPVMRPFLQDVPQFGPLGLTLGFQILTNPLFLYTIYKCVGFETLLDWLPHFLNLGLYGVLAAITRPLRPLCSSLPSKERYQIRRLLDAWEFGSGADYRPD